MTEESPLDADGQPIIRAFNAARISDRQQDELIGLVRGVIADGAVHQSEAEFLIRWIESNAGSSDRWPASLLYPRLRSMLADGVLDQEERSELFELLQRYSGNTPGVEERSVRRSTTLPLDHPQPTLKIQGSIFVVTGKFVYGIRKKVHAAIEARGGTCGGDVTLGTDILVIGEIGSTDWVHSTHGRKIERAMELRSKGGRPIIVDELHWAQQLGLAT